MSLTVPLIILVVLLVGSVGVAIASYQANRSRIATLARAGGGRSALADKVPLITLPDATNSWAVRISETAERLLPEGAMGADSGELLVQAGFESPSAPAIYALTRVASALLIPGAMFAFGPHDSSLMLLFSGAIGVALGLIAPSAILTRIRRLRQERIRHSIPDSLDLLLVCV